MKKRIRKKKMCGDCGKYQLNIWRHSAKVHGKMRNQKVRNVVSKKGYIYKRCPVTKPRKCHQVVSRLREHLIRSHNIENHSKALLLLLDRAEKVTEEIESDKEIDSDKQGLIEEIKTEQEDIPIYEATRIPETRDIGIQVEDSEEEYIELEIKQENNVSGGETFAEEIIIIGDSDEDSNFLAELEVIDDGGKDLVAEVIDGENVVDEPKANQDLKTRGLFINNTVIRKFIAWVQKPPYVKLRRTALQHGAQAYQVWTFITPNHTIEGLLETSRLDNWYIDAMTQMAPGTVRSYLSSLRIFIEFLIDTGSIKKDIWRATRFQNHIIRTSKSLQKPIRLRRTVVETEEIETMLVPADIQSFLDSDIAKECKETLLQPTPMELVPKAFFDIRNFLLLRLIQSNAQRPLAIRNITERSLSRANRTDDGGAVLTIADHKTAQTGPVMIGLSQEMYKMLRNYVQLCRHIPGFVPDSSRSIFITWPKPGGEVVPLSTSQINKSLQKIWAQGPISKSITATRLRKATATAVRAAVPGSREILAKHMTHAPETADRHYALYSQRKMTSPVVQMIASVMEGSRNPMKTIQNSAHWPTKDILPIAEKETEGDCDPTNSDQTVDYDYEEEQTRPSSPLNSCELALSESEQDALERCENTHKRRSFSKSESDSLLKMCRQNLKTGNMYKHQIMKSLLEVEEGRILFNKLRIKFDKKDYKKMIVDRVRAEYRRRQKKQHEDV